MAQSKTRPATGKAGAPDALVADLSKLAVEERPAHGQSGGTDFWASWGRSHSSSASKEKHAASGEAVARRSRAREARSQTEARVPRISGDSARQHASVEQHSRSSDRNPRVVAVEDLERQRDNTLKMSTEATPTAKFVSIHEVERLHHKAGPDETGHKPVKITSLEDIERRQAEQAAQHERNFPQLPPSAPPRHNKPHPMSILNRPSKQEIQQKKLEEELRQQEEQRAVEEKLSAEDMERRKKEAATLARTGLSHFDDSLKAFKACDYESAQESAKLGRACFVSCLVEHKEWSLRLKPRLVDRIWVLDHKLASTAGAKGSQALQPQQLAAVVRIIEDSISFYETLLRKLGLASGFVHSETAPVGGDRKDGDATEHELREGQVVLVKDHARAIIGQWCLLCLGDLERYAQLRSNEGRNWLKAQRYYADALTLAPENGRCQNQLAVIAQYRGDDLEAVYRYFMALSAQQPYMPARENLLTLFDKNRSKKRDKMKAKDSFVNSAVTVYGILFTGVSLELLETLSSRCLNDLNVLLEDGVPDASLFKCVAMNIFCIHNSIRDENGCVDFQPEVFPPCDTWQPGLTVGSLSFTYNFYACLAATCRFDRFPYLAPVCVFLEWFQAYPQVAQETQSVADEIGSAVFDLKAAFARLLNCVPTQHPLVPGNTPDLVHFNVALDEDLELKGFLPLGSVVLERRSGGPQANPDDIRYFRLRSATTFLLRSGLVYFHEKVGLFSADSSVPPERPPHIRLVDEGGIREADQVPDAAVAVSPSPVGGLLKGIDMSKLKITKNRESTRGSDGGVATGEKLVVLDAMNVGLRHGLNKVLSCKGIQLCLDYWQGKGYRAIGFVPDYVVDYEQVGKRRRAQNLQIQNAKTKVPDDVALLNKLVEEGRLISTPSQDYDDSYCIQYARLKGGFIVTNDRYWDHIDKQAPGKQRKETLEWIRRHCISYTWAGDEFLPNPDFVF
eukprot:scaffold7405_cov376-Prasinococcus_capsulatus_cf.AAC.1